MSSLGQRIFDPFLMVPSRNIMGMYWVCCNYVIFDVDTEQHIEISLAM